MPNISGDVSPVAKNSQFFKIKWNCVKSVQPAFIFFHIINSDLSAGIQLVWEQQQAMYVAM